MLQPTSPDETPELVRIAEGTGVFKPHELVALQEVLEDYHAINHTYGHQSVSWVDGIAQGFVYFAPTAMTDRTWEIWWIAIEKTLQGQGLGTKLLQFAEDYVKQNTGRLLLIETSSTSLYEPTRDFYLKHGYTICATIDDFYADGDGKVVFRKKF